MNWKQMLYFCKTNIKIDMQFHKCHPCYDSQRLNRYVQLLDVYVVSFLLLKQEEISLQLGICPKYLSQFNGHRQQSHSILVSLLMLAQAGPLEVFWSCKFVQLENDHHWSFFLEAVLCDDWPLTEILGHLLVINECFTTFVSFYYITQPIWQN